MMEMMRVRGGNSLKIVLELLAAMLLAGACALGCSSGGGGGGDSGDGGVVTLGGVNGSVTLPERLEFDSDTPDPNNPQVDNGTTATAQAIANLVDVAGYVDSASDAEDYFSVALSAGEKIYLKIADAGADLDLYLYQGGTVDSSTSVLAQVETVTAPADGDYFILVQAASGGSIYNLVVGLSPLGTPTGLQSWSPDEEFVPGEAIVKFKASGQNALIPAASGQESAAALSGARLAAARAQADDFAAARGAWVHSFDPRGLALVKFADAAQVQGADDEAPDGAARLAAKRATLQKIRELGHDPRVAWAEPNFMVQAAVVPDDEYYYLQWNLDHISMPEAWDVENGNTSIIIAVVDTGVLYDHPDLAANILKDGATVVGYDMILDPSMALDGNGRDPDPYDVGDRNLKYGNTVFSSFHGTHVAGIASAATNNGDGVAGVGWKTRIMPVRVLGHGGGTLYDVAQGIYFAAGLPNVTGALPMIGDTVTPAHIINLSLGGTSNNIDMQNAISAARAAGVIVVAAAGNNNTSASFYPAALNGVIGVSAVDYAGDRAYYSNYGSYVDIAAPGGNLDAFLNGQTCPDGSPCPDGILSTLADDSSGHIVLGYGFSSGTSMASPHVAGVAALMKSVFEKNAPQDAKFNPLILDALIQGTISSDSVGSITNYAKGSREPYLGYGLINGKKAVDAAIALAGDTQALAPHLELEPDQLSFGFSAAQLYTLIANRGFKPLEGVAVDPSYQDAAPWLSHLLQGSTLTFTVVRGDTLSNGAYQASVAVGSLNGGTAIAAITMCKGEPVTSAAGTVYVILVNTATNAQLQVATDPIKGYYFSFTGVPAGAYMLIAGTNINNDTYLGDNGELMGAYPDIGAPQVLSISGITLGNRNFPLQFLGLPVPDAEEGTAR